MTMIGIAITTTYAPLSELRDRGDHEHDPRHRGADAVQGRAPTPARALHPEPPPDHPRLRQRERGEDADHVELDQPRELRVVEPDEEERERREDEDAVGEHEAVAAVAELARHELIARQDRGQPREVLERGVRREHEDPRREDLQQDEPQSRRRRPRRRSGRARIAIARPPR